MCDTNTDFEIAEIKDWVLLGGESLLYPRNDKKRKNRYIRGRAIKILNQLIKPRIKKNGRWIVLKDGELVDRVLKQEFIKG